MSIESLNQMNIINRLNRLNETMTLCIQCTDITIKLTVIINLTFFQTGGDVEACKRNEHYPEARSRPASLWQQDTGGHVTQGQYTGVLSSHRTSWLTLRLALLCHFFFISSLVTIWPFLWFFDGLDVAQDPKKYIQIYEVGTSKRQTSLSW